VTTVTAPTPARMIPLQFTPALAVAVGGYAVLVIAFGAALLDARQVAPGR
jgi:hypothetical protein